MKYIVRLNDKEYEVEVEKGKANLLKVNTVASAPPVTPVPAAPTAPAQAAPASQVSAAANVSVSDGEIVKAPMPGAILDIKVNVGSNVKKGDVLMILEAMKMENEITAPVDGVVKQILVSKGATVETNNALLVIG